MSGSNTLYSGWLERISNRDTRGKERREKLWSVLKRDGHIYFFTHQVEHTDNTHTGILPINENTVFTRREKEEKKYEGYVFTVFVRDKTFESNIKFKTQKMSAMEEWRGYISIVGKGRLPPDLDLPTEYIHELGFVLDRYRREGQTTRPPSIQTDRDSGHGSIRPPSIQTDRDSGHDSISRLTMTESVSMGSGSGGSHASANSEARIGKRHKFSNNPNGDQVYPSWFVPDCSRDRSMAIFRQTRLKYGNTLMRESSRSASEGTYVITHCFGMDRGEPACDHFKVLRTYAGFRIELDTKHPDMTNLTEVMTFFVRVNELKRTQPLTTNDMASLGLTDPDYTTYLPDSGRRQSMEQSRDSSSKSLTDGSRPRQIAEPSPDYDYEAPVQTVRPKTVGPISGRPMSELRNPQQRSNPEPRRSGVPYPESGNQTVAPVRRHVRTQLPQTRFSMSDLPPSTAVSPWEQEQQNRRQFSRPVLDASRARPAVQSAEPPPSACTAAPTLGYENDDPEFCKVSSCEPKPADKSKERAPPPYKAPPPPATTTPPPYKAPPPPATTTPPPYKAPPPPATTTQVKTTSRGPPSFKPPQSPPQIIVTEESLDAQIPAPPPPPTLPSQLVNVGSNVTAPQIPPPPPTPPPPPPQPAQIDSRMKTAASVDYDDVAPRVTFNRRPASPNILGNMGENHDKYKNRSQSVPNLEHQLQGLAIDRFRNLQQLVGTSVFQRTPPMSVLPKQSGRVDTGGREDSQPGVNSSPPKRVEDLTKMFSQQRSRSISGSTNASVPYSRTPDNAVYINNETHQLLGQDVIYANDTGDEIYENSNVDEAEDYVDIDTDTEKAVPTLNPDFDSGIDTTGGATVEELKRRLKLDEVLIQPGSSSATQVVSPVRTPVNKRDIPLPAIPTENPMCKDDEIYDSVNDDEYCASRARPHTS